MSETFDYHNCTSGEMVTHCGDSGERWAEAFMQIHGCSRNSLSEIDKGLMIGWFANAIETASVVRGQPTAPAGALTEAVRGAIAALWNIHLALDNAMEGAGMPEFEIYSHNSAYAREQALLLKCAISALPGNSVKGVE